MKGRILIALMVFSIFVVGCTRQDAETEPVSVKEAEKVEKINEKGDDAAKDGDIDRAEIEAVTKTVKMYFTELLDSDFDDAVTHIDGMPFKTYLDDEEFENWMERELYTEPDWQILELCNELTEFRIGEVKVDGEKANVTGILKTADRDSVIKIIESKLKSENIEIDTMDEVEDFFESLDRTAFERTDKEVQLTLKKSGNGWKILEDELIKSLMPIAQEDVDRYEEWKKAGIAVTPDNPSIEGNLIPGVYTGECSGFSNSCPICLSVTIGDDSTISSVEVTAQQETPKIGGVALRQLSQSVIGKNTAEVDLIAGATVTSEAFREALSRALEQAAGN